MSQRSWRGIRGGGDGEVEEGKSKEMEGVSQRTKEG